VDVPALGAEGFWVGVFVLRAGMHNLRPTGLIRPANVFYTALAAS